MKLDLGLDWNPDSTDVCFTPPSVFAALGLTFDLDPATLPGGVPWVPAERHYSELDDGLTQPWDGRIWLNPPYSNPRPWIEKLSWNGNDVALLPADTATSWFHDFVTKADGFCFIKGRLRFVRNDRGEETSARFPSILVGWGEECGDAVRNCGLGWCP